MTRLPVAFAVLAAAVLAACCAKALVDVSTAWDVWYYHLPFAGRLVGILPTSVYRFHPLNEARLVGFPLLAELVQGVLWRITGRPEGANLLAFASVLAFVAFLRRLFHVPWAATVLALFAVPLVHTHAAAAYVDLPANVAATVGILVVARAHSEGRSLRHLETVALLGSVVVTINIKFQLAPVAMATLLGATPFLRPLWRARRVGAFAGLAAALVVASATPLKNLALHGNPFFPVRFHVGPWEPPWREEVDITAPPDLVSVPSPVRFVCSLLELHAAPLADPHRWTIDQFRPDETGGNHMGGFFHLWVLLNIVTFAALVLREHRLGEGNRRRARALGVTMGLLTALVSVLPQSHQIRYYLVWMLVLMASNLALLSTSTWAPRWSLSAYTAAATLAFAVVTASTRGAYLWPSGYGTRDLVRDKVEGALLDGVRDGQTVCFYKEPWTVLYAAPFHPPRHHVVQEALEETACPGGVWRGP